MSRKELSDEEILATFASITRTFKSITSLLDQVVANNEAMIETLRSLAELYDFEPPTKEKP